MKLADAMNTYNPALLTIIRKGFDISLLPSKDDNELGNWRATNDSHDFIASDPLKLLGLISIWEVRGENWQKRPEEEDLYNAILDEAFDDE